MLFEAKCYICKRISLFSRKLEQNLTFVVQFLAGGAE